MTTPEPLPSTVAELRQQAQHWAGLVEQVQALLGVVHATAATLPDRVAASDWGTDAITRAVDDLADIADAGLDDAGALTAVDEQLQHVQVALTTAEQLGVQVAQLHATGLVEAFLAAPGSGHDPEAGRPPLTVVIPESPGPAATPPQAGATMSDYITAIDSTGLDVHGQKALRDLPAAVRQLVGVMAARGWNWGVYTYPYQDGCGSRCRDVGGANPDTGDRVSFVWQSSLDLRRGWGRWTPYRLIVQESREGFGALHHTTVKDALAFVTSCSSRAITPPSPDQHDHGEMVDIDPELPDPIDPQTDPHDDLAVPSGEGAGRLVRDDPAWRYPGLHATVSARRLRVWQTPDGALVAVLTEGPGAEGTSLANAAEQVVAQLQAEYGPGVEVIEHQLPWQPAQPGDPEERWTLTGLSVGTGDSAPDGVEYLELGPVPHVIPGGLERVLLDARGQATWWPVTSADLARRLAGGPWWDPEPR